MRRRRSTVFQPRIKPNRTERHEQYVAIVRLCLLIVLALLLGRALHAFLYGIFPFAEDSIALRLMPVVIGGAIVFTLVAAVRAAIQIRRNLRR